MAEAILYVVALSSDQAERNLRHIGHNPNIMGDPKNAELRAKQQSELWGMPYKVFKGRVTVEMLED